MKKFLAYLIEEKIDQTFLSSIVERKESDLPSGDLLIKVAYSAINYKDVLSIQGNRGITKKYPHVPGIDASGTVVESASMYFKAGDSVIITGYDFGMNTDGGLEQYIRIPAEWAVPLPKGMSLYEAMCYGTAGLTAAQSVQKLSSVIHPGDGPILVSGATGAVGSFSVAILSKLGYHVIATTGKKDSEKYLQEMGAAQIEAREKWNIPTDPMMLSATLAGAIDTVGGTQLTNILKSVKMHGAVTCCGMIGSTDLTVSIFPFILRGVTLFGITTQNLQPASRSILWNLLAHSYSVPAAIAHCTVIGLTDIDKYVNLILAGKNKGRVVVDLWK